MIAGNTLYLGDLDGTMLWLNADTGKLLGALATRQSDCVFGCRQQ